MWSLNKAWRGVASITTTGIEPSATRLLASSLWYVSCYIVTVEIFVFCVQGPVLQRWFVQLDKIIGPSLTVKGANSFHHHFRKQEPTHSSCSISWCSHLCSCSSEDACGSALLCSRVPGLSPPYSLDLTRSTIITDPRPTQAS